MRSLGIFEREEKRHCAKCLLLRLQVTWCMVCIRKTAPQGEFKVELESIENEFQSDQDGQTLCREEVKNMGFS